ncbi:MFS transporter [Enterobacter asburiae]|uniref:HdeD family acid-resistance protein n=1 Tax=Scandinavium sp. UTDF21-P1B TaxID=3446379 RepID=UPI003497495A
MLHIALLLLGADFVRKNAGYLGILGLLWGALGVSIFIDGMQGIRYFPLHIFGILLLIESLFTLILASGGIGAQKAVFFFKGGIFCFVALLILSGRQNSDILLAIIFGFSWFITGLFTIVSAWVVRFAHWRSTIFGGCAQIAFALFLFLPWPTHHLGTISQFIGMVMMLGSLHILRLSVRLRELREGSSVFTLLAPGGLMTELNPANIELFKPQRAAAAQAHDNPSLTKGELTVHVWTPEGSSAGPTLNRPILNRYIAAVDTNDVISTGHAALEFKPHLYISLYPAVDIERSPSEFLRLLKATQENNVPGEYKKDYASEAAAWCESDRKITFSHVNQSSLERFWQAYRSEEIYNLTWRNCSSSVAYGLEAALDGVLSGRPHPWLTFLRLLIIPELWIASQLRKRATTMAWTPGIVLDYARALHAIVHPLPLSLFYRRKNKELSE